MKYRDSSGVTHFESNVIAGAKGTNMHAVRIYGNSSSEKAGIEPVSDSTVAHLDISAKGGDGLLRLGSTKNGSTSGVYLGSTTVNNSSAASAIPIKGFFRSTLAFTQAAISSGQIAELTVASTTADVQPTDWVSWYVAWSTTPGAVVQGGHRLSTANASRMTVILANPGSSATSTLSGVLNISWIDVT